MKPQVSLEEITEDTLDAVLELEVTDDQKTYVPSNAVSIARAYFSKESWFRAIYVDGEPVGFVILHLDAHKAQYFLKTLMIDRKHQGKGFGTLAMEQVADFVRSLPDARELLTSYPREKTGPKSFYEKLGFEATGLEEDGDIIMSKEL